VLFLLDIQVNMELSAVEELLKGIARLNSTMWVHVAYPVPSAKTRAIWSASYIFSAPRFAKMKPRDKAIAEAATYLAMLTERGLPQTSRDSHRAITNLPAA
jgi:hypothetical protein